MSRIDTWTPGQIAAFQSVKQRPDPEDRFTELVQEAVSAAELVVDLGTGTGNWFAKHVAPRASLAIGVDESALSLARAPLGKGASFIRGDSAALPLADGVASVIISRRGPLSAGPEFIREAIRVLAPGGLALEITIGEQNAREVTEVFDTSQMAEEARLGPRLDRLMTELGSWGLEPLVCEDYCSIEYFPSAEGLLFRLRTTPILPAFNPLGDGLRFDELVRRNTTPVGIGLTYHRLIWSARKAA